METKRVVVELDYKELGRIALNVYGQCGFELKEYLEKMEEMNSLITTRMI